MAVVSDIEAVIEFLRKYGFSESESALREDVKEKSQLGSTDFERFLFPMVPPPPRLKIPSTSTTSSSRFRQSSSAADHAFPTVGNSSSDDDDDDDDEEEEEEFVSLDSSTTEFCSSEFTNPYGIRTTTRPCSRSSSDSLSQFGTARDYHEFDMQNDMYWYKENDEDYVMPPVFGISDILGGPSEDKFVMTEVTGKPGENGISVNHVPERFKSVGGTNDCDKKWPTNSTKNADDEVFKDYYDLKKHVHFEERINKVRDCTDYSCSSPLCACCGGTGSNYVRDVDCGFPTMKAAEVNGNLCEPICEGSTAIEAKYSVKDNSVFDWFGDLKIDDFGTQIIKDDYPLTENGHQEARGDAEAAEPCDPNLAVDEESCTISDELMMYTSREEEYEVFNLKIIHRKNRTGFEESKEFPIIISSIIAGRYFVTEYLGSAAFSKVIQAHDLHTGLDVCLKIIKNDKDFFDQSLDEIKLLKFVNKHDPCDERHILRLYDYFYHQEHLFIVCELLRANLYEFQKYNRESGGEPYFTLARLQVITRQCLEALEFLHDLGVIHCDLKPENILIKSYRRCEIKVIDLGSSCFSTDNLSLYVQSRSYRAPEVMLGLPYDQKIDIWSLGCILAELYSGEVLFPNEAIAMLIAQMISILGPIHMDMLQQGVDTHKYFTKEYDLYYINEETNQLEYIIPEETSSLEQHLQISDPLFLDFIQKLLEINPERRLTAREALEHPWLSHRYECSSNNNTTSCNPP